MIKGAKKPGQYHLKDRVMEGNGGQEFGTTGQRCHWGAQEKKPAKVRQSRGEEKRQRDRKEQEEEEEMNRTGQHRVEAPDRRQSSACSFAAGREMDGTNWSCP